MNDRDYFNKVYKEACEITAYLCKMFNIDPHGTVKYGNINVPTILCHQDSYQLGLGSNHGENVGDGVEGASGNFAFILSEQTLNPLHHLPCGLTGKGQHEE